MFNKFAKMIASYLDTAPRCVDAAILEIVKNPEGEVMLHIRLDHLHFFLQATDLKEFRSGLNQVDLFPNRDADEI